MANHTSVEVTASRSAGHQFATLVRPLPLVEPLTFIFSWPNSGLGDPIPHRPQNIDNDEDSQPPYRPMEKPKPSLDHPP